VVNINDVLDGHVALDLDCLDRLYLNAYVPNLQVGGQVVTFLTQHLGNEVPSRVLFKRIGDRFRQAVAAFAQHQGIPLLHLKRPDRTRWDDRKLDPVRPHLEQAQREGRCGVVAIVVAQEVQKVFMGSQRGKDTHGKAVNFGFDKADRAVTVHYVDVLDADLGPGFIKLCSYFPYPAKVWLNGHEWAKRQAAKAGLAVTELANGFAACDHPASLQRICDRLGPATIQGFFDRWITQIPTPSPPPTGRPATGGSCPCARSRSAGRSWLTTRAEPAASLRPWWPTPSVSAGPSRSRSCSPARSAPPPRSRFAPGSSARAPR
jgi:hypothetical protein